MFPSLETPGIDLMIPDLGYLEELGNRLLGVLVTHGHEDHIGALPFLLREREVPIYATAFSMALIEAKLAEHKVLDKAARTTFAPRDRWRLGPFEVEALQMTHSIVDAVGFAIRTPRRHDRPYRRLQDRPHADRRSRLRSRSPGRDRRGGRAVAALRFDQRRSSRHHAVRAHRARAVSSAPSSGPGAGSWSRHSPPTSTACSRWSICR